MILIFPIQLYFINIMNLAVKIPLYVLNGETWYSFSFSTDIACSETVRKPRQASRVARVPVVRAAETYSTRSMILKMKSFTILMFSHLFRI